MSDVRSQGQGTLPFSTWNFVWDSNCIDRSEEQALHRACYQELDELATRQQENPRRYRQVQCHVRKGEVQERRRVASKTGYSPHQISNAYLKFSELLAFLQTTHGDLCTSLLDEEMLFGCAWPGSAILAWRQRREMSLARRWWGNSLTKSIDVSVNDRRVHISPLEDRYKLWAMNPDAWLMDNRAGGNLFAQRHYDHVRAQLSRIKHHVVSAFADGGFECKDHEHFVEELHFPLLVGELQETLLWFSTSSSRSAFRCCLLKCFEVTHRATRWLLSTLAQKAVHAHWIKPKYSRRLNGELYVVLIWSTEEIAALLTVVTSIWHRIYQEENRFEWRDDDFEEVSLRTPMVPLLRARRKAMRTWLQQWEHAAEPRSGKRRQARKRERPNKRR